MVIEVAALLSLHQWNFQIGAFIIILGIVKFHLLFSWIYRKRFDTLDHNILLHKLDHYGIRGVAKQLFESYITNRQQFVQINDIRSKVITTNIGVPQGSVLGTILFNIYINDIHKCTNNFDIINYADDTNTYINH